MPKKNEHKIEQRRRVAPATQGQRDFAARVARRIREIRLEKDITQSELFERTGLPMATISCIENGIRWRRRFVDLRLLAHGLRCNVADFFLTPEKHDSMMRLLPAKEDHK